VNRALFISYLLILSSCSLGSDSTSKEGNSTTHETLDHSATIQNLKTFSSNNAYNTQYSIVIDMSIRSGKYRLFLYDLNTNKILVKGLCAHGHCGNYMKRTIKFSNVSGSNCSSLGKFKIGAKYQGRFGTAYKLHGLDSTNSNAFSRFVVLHAHSCVPDEETITGICKSEGCPTVSPNILKELEPYLDQAEKPILLTILD